MPADPAERRRIEDLVARNLKGGRVDLTIRTRDGLTYTVSRSPGDDPIVKTAEGKVTDLGVAGGGLFPLSVFSQNEVEQIADRAASQLDLLDRFEPERIAAFTHQMDAAKHQLELNASRLKPLREQVLLLSEELKGGDAVEEHLRAFGSEGGDSAEVINQAHAAKALRDREARSLKGAKELVAESGKGVKALVGVMAGRAHRVVAEEMLHGRNGQPMGELASELADAARAVDRHLEAALDRLNDCWQRVSALDGTVPQVHREQEVAFQQLLESHKEAQEKASERSRLEKLRNELRAKTAELGQIQEQIAALEGERQQLMDRLTSQDDSHAD
jgi:DNA repair exonuclease SbcCD ATPase subunit